MVRPTIRFTPPRKIICCGCHVIDATLNNS